MSEALNDYINERVRIHDAATGGWEHDPEEDGGTFWAGLGRSDFHLNTEDAAAAVDAHNESPKAWAALKAVLEMCDPKYDSDTFDPEADAQDGFAKAVRELIAKEMGINTQ